MKVNTNDTEINSLCLCRVDWRPARQ